MEWFFGHEGISLSCDEIQGMYWEEYNPTACLLMPGVLDVLTTLVQSRELVVVSSAATSYIADRIRVLGLGHFFTEVHSGQDKKVETIQDVCRRFGIQTSDTFLVGDMGSDVDCAEQAGACSILLADHESPYVSRATRHITDIRQLPDVLK